MTISETLTIVGSAMVLIGAVIFVVFTILIMSSTDYDRTVAMYNLFVNYFSKPILFKTNNCMIGGWGYNGYYRNIYHSCRYKINECAIK